MNVTRFVPRIVKQPLKQRYLSRQLALGLRALRGGQVTDATLMQLRTGWDNTGWDAKPVYLKELIKALRTTSGPVLECGSGLSTIVLAALAPHRVRISLEHNPAWAARVNAVLKLHRLTADIRVAPLADYPAGVRWYSAPADLPPGIDFVICDGPDSYGRGRYGVLPVVRRQLAPGALVLFDDAGAEGQKGVLDAWTREFGARVEQKHVDAVDYAIVRIP
jgi:predicted O-methyltransferase YrrM